MTQQLFNTEYDEDYSEEIVTELDISHLTIEDDTPVDNFQLTRLYPGGGNRAGSTVKQARAV